MPSKIVRELSRERKRGRKVIPRDEIVRRGLESRGKHRHPWVYELKVKSGTSNTESFSTEAYNRVDLYGQIIASKAKDGEDIFAFNVSRILKSQFKSKSDK